MKLTTKNQNPLNYIEATLELVKLKGNKLPHFSLTGRVVINGQDVLSGAIHKEILAVFPELAQAVALHLSDISGRPMHSFENGKYWAGFTQWQEGSTRFLSDHWRISQEEAAGLLYDALMAKLWADGDQFTTAEELLKDFHDSQIPRWNDEAKDVINNYNLQVVEK
jgi:hypothetical protein